MTSQRFNFFSSVVFRHTVAYLSLFILSELIVFGVLYWSTVAVYEQRHNELLESDLVLLQGQFAGMSEGEMALVVTRRCQDEPGEIDEYLLARHDFSYIAGNIPSWPGEVRPGAPRIDLAVLGGPDADPRPELHRVRAVRLAGGQHLLVGRNLTELQHMRTLIGKALLRTILLTVLVGVAGGLVLARRLSTRLDRVSRRALAILQGDMRQRLPLSRRGDEFDVLAANINRMLSQIESLMDAMREVTDNIAHDMRQPISRMRSRIELALMGRHDAGAFRETLRETLEELERMLAVFNALLTIALAESGARRDFEELDLARVARSTLEVYEPVAEDAGIELTLAGDERVPLRGNPHLLAQALANLLDNAVKHAAGSGAVEVRVSRGAPGAELVVTDRGPGIPAAQRDRVLERFTRLDRSRSTPGSGLGLSLVQAVASLHGADLELADNGPGLRVTLRFSASSA